MFPTDAYTSSGSPFVPRTVGFRGRPEPVTTGSPNEKDSDCETRVEKVSSDPPYLPGKYTLRNAAECMGFHPYQLIKMISYRVLYGYGLRFPHFG